MRPNQFPTLLLRRLARNITIISGDAMRYGIGLSLAVLIASACSVGVDSPVAVESPSFAKEGVKPPPPLGSGDVEIEISYSPEFPELQFEGGPSATSFEEYPEFDSEVHARYFANTQGTNGWLQFLSEGDCVASPNAKLQYNEKTGKTQGHGTLTCEGETLDLSKIEITWGGFGNCVLDPYSLKYECDEFDFSYNGVPGGRFRFINDD